MSEEIRVLREEDLDRYLNMAAQAFRVDAPGAARWRSDMTPGSQRGLFVDGDLKTGLVAHDFDTWVGPATIPTAGLAAVASPPENRRKGYIERLLHAVLAECRESGRPLCTLYPFYYPFYKRYGWSHVVDSIHYKIPMDRITLGRTPGSWYRVYVHTSLPNDAPDGGISAEDLAILMGIYDQWCVGKIGMLKRTETRWRRNVLGIGRDKRSDVYYWRDEAGTPRAYLIYNFESHESSWVRTMNCDFVALDPTALRATLEFIRMHDSQAQDVHTRQPESLRLLTLIENPELKAEVEAGLMLRFADIAAAITMRQYSPEIRANFTFEVADSFLDWNPGVYEVEVEGGAASCERSQKEPGFSLDQKTLAQLYFGYLRPHEARDLGLLDVRDSNALDQAAIAFAGPRPWIGDFF